MLAEWYFCCCISLSPSDTNTFLSILETLENPDSNSHLLYLAYNELQRTEDWMQVYALPQVLKSLHGENCSAGVKNIIKRYFNGLIDHLPEDVSEELREILEQLVDLALLDKPPVQDIIKTIKLFAQESKNLPERPIAPTPYFDLKEFLPETLVLAVIADQITINKEFINEISSEFEELEEKSSYLNLLLENALDYQFGRLAFRLATVIAYVASNQYGLDKLQSLIVVKASAGAELEPDLLYTYAKVLFWNDIDKENSSQKSRLCQKIVQESLKLTYLRRLIHESSNKKSSNAFNFPLRRIGLSSTNRTISLPIIYWQATLWELASRIDEQETANELVKFWQPRRFMSKKNPRNIKIGFPEPQEVNYWKEQLNSLLNLHNNLHTISFDIKTRTNYFFIDYRYAWLFVSPWIDFNFNKHNGRIEYLNAEKPELLIRLFVCASIAVKLLQRLSVNNYNSVEFAAKFIAHASDFIDKTYNQWLNNYRGKQNTNQLPHQSSAFTGFALFARRQIKMAGTGRLNSIHPQIFVQVCENNPKNKGEETNKLPINEQTFLDSILPKVLMSWIKDAYPSAVGASGSVRWLDLIPDVYFYHKQGNKNYLEMQEAALVARFLCPQYELTLDEKLDWKKERDKYTTGWTIHYRQLLLTERQLDPDEWHGEKWKSAIWYKNNDVRYSCSNHLVRAIELLDAIGHRGKEYSITPQNLESWYSESNDCLNSVEQLRQLDRFVRLRLLEFLDSPILRDRLDEQKLIAFVLLEYGGIYELKQLFKRVFCTEVDGGKRLKNVNSARQELQETLLQKMHEQVVQNASLLQDSYNEVDTYNRRNAQDPRKTAIEFQKAEIYKNWIEKIAYLSGITENIEDFSELGSILANLRQESLEKKAQTNTRAKTFDIELRNDQKLILIPSTEQKIADWSIRAAVYDPNRLATTLFYEDYDTSGIINLFKKREEEIHALKHQDEKPLYVLAVVINIEERSDKTREQFKYTFNCGFHFPIYRSLPGKYFQIGDYVELPIRQVQNHDEWWWRSPPSHKINKLQFRLRPGDINKVIVREYWNQSTKKRYVRLQREIGLKETEDITSNINLHLWDADISRSFRNFGQPEDRKVFAKFNNNQEWVPVDLNFNDLLINAFTNDNDYVVVLTLIGETNSLIGERAWRFSHVPGENYLFERHDFLLNDAELLEEEISKYQNRKNKSHGLLVSVKCDFQDGKAGLRLVTESVESNEPNKLYPNLSVPFDERNIIWRELFDSFTEGALAEKIGSNWVFTLKENPVPGYPHNIGVEWEHRKPDSKAQTADLLVIQWEESDWRKAVVLAEHPRFYKIEPQNRDWKNFLQRWLNIPQGRYMETGLRIKLSKAVRWLTREGDGFISCFTTENIHVLVQAESLTMRPLKHQSKPDIGDNRDAEVFRMEWFPIRTNPDIKNPQIPSDAIQNNQCVGILTLVPDASTGTQCRVVWQTVSGATDEEEIQIDNLAELRISQGYKIVGHINNNVWNFHIESPYIQARALWSLRDWQDGDQNLCYLGIVSSSEGEDWKIAESKPGQLVRLTNKFRDVKHFAIGDGIKFKESGSWQYQSTQNTTRWRKSWDELPFQYKRAVLTINERLLSGNCRADTPTGKLSVKNIKLELVNNNDKYVLRRRFELHPIFYVSEENKKVTVNDTDKWKKRWGEYLQKPQPETLKATITEEEGEISFCLPSGERNEIRVPTNPEQTKWTSRVSLAPNQGAFVMEGNYSNQATICLFEEQNNILASCRLVPPLTPEKFKIDYCEAPSLNTYVSLVEKRIKLYYVGSEESNQVTGEIYGEIHHRFEIGYGETLLIPESQLEFDGGSFKNARFLIFHGDLIKGITFKEEKYESSETEPISKCIININGIDLQWSEARRLYNQRKQYQIVHLLHLNIYIDPRKIYFKIAYIDGFNENGFVEKRSFKFKKLQPRLTKESENSLSNRYRKYGENTEKTALIFGRLDDEHYVNTGGRELLFEHVRLSFEESELGSPLISNDLVFLKAGEISEWGRNDMALALLPPKGIDKKDVGKDVLNRLRLLRRSFSVRENLLKQVYDEQGKSEFAGNLLLVRLTKDNNGRILSFLLMQGEKVPTRKAKALRGVITNAGKAGLLATVVEVESKSIQIELKPGIFVKLKQRWDIEECPKDLAKGAIIQIELASQDKFRIIRAAFGDAQYVSKSIRPAVMLPKNDLFKINDPQSWLDKRSFVIGGLPNIVAQPGDYDVKKLAWHKLRSEKIIEIMEKSHPKIVCLGKASDGRYRVAPPSNQFPCGKLVKGEGSLNVSYVPLNPEPNNSNLSNLSWHLLSFGDESVQNIIERASIEKWRYHDNETATWVSKDEKFDGEFKFENLRDRRHDVWTGPIFFYSLHDKLSLRYPKRDFRKFGFPVEELIYSLKQRKKSKWYPVAGVYQPPEISLWIELAPGRVVELPVHLIVLRSEVNEKHKSLANLLHWQSFAPGDWVELELVSTDPLTIDRIALKNWIPGSRNAFGSQRCFLPVLGADEKNGETTFGGGEFELKLPFTDQNVTGATVILTTDNRLIDLSTLPTIQQKPKPNDVVFLSWDQAKEKPIVLGLNSLKVYPTQNPACWKNEPLANNLIISSQEGFHLDFRRLKHLLTVIGGVLAITVEEFSEQDDSIYFSMRHQRYASFKDSVGVSIARVVGLLDDYTVILRCGGELLKISMRQVVSGLDRQLYKAAVEALRKGKKKEQILIWLRKEEDKEITVGFKDEFDRKEILVESLDIILQNEAKEETGLICRSIDSMALYWLPITEATWTNLSVEEFRTLFKSKGAFKVKHIMEKGYVSVIDVPEVYEEAKNLTVGKELRVEVIQKTQSSETDKQRYLVKSFTTQVILDCEIYDDQKLQPGEIILVEVVKYIKDKPKLITVVPQGKKLKYLDLPTWMTRKLPEPGQRRLASRDYTIWRRIPQLDLTSENAQSLDRFLCHAYNDAYGTFGQTAKDAHLQFQLKAAESWEEQNRNKDEINVAYAIMAILLLDKNGAKEAKIRACKLTQNIGRRALRSMHVELLYQTWLAIKENRERDDGLWRRLGQLESERHLHTPLQETSINLIKQFCNAVKLRNDSELLPIAKGLSAALGKLSAIEVFDDYSEVTTRLRNIYKTLPSTRSSSVLWLNESHIIKLREILTIIEIKGLDITILKSLDNTVIPYSRTQKSYDYLSLINLLPSENITLDRTSKILLQINRLHGLIDDLDPIKDRIRELKSRFNK